MTVVDSGHLSSSMGLAVLCAAYMAEHHASKRRHQDGPPLDLLEDEDVLVDIRLLNLLADPYQLLYTKGSKFIVTLDQDIIDEKALGTFTLTSRSRSHEGETYRQSFEAPDAHILVVDDNDMNRCPCRYPTAESPR